MSLLSSLAFDELSSDSCCFKMVSACFSWEEVGILKLSFLERGVSEEVSLASINMKRSEVFWSKCYIV